MGGPLPSAPEHREKLEAWVLAQLRGQSSVDLAERRGWALRTMQWGRDKAAGIVAYRLNRLGVDVW